MSLLLYIASPVAGQSSAVNNERQDCSRFCPKCYLAVLFEAEQNYYFFNIQSR